MIKVFIFSSIILFCELNFAGTAIERLNKNGVALCPDRDSVTDGDCYDPVSYFKDNRAVKAGVDNSKKFRVAFEGATYVFSSQNHMELFKKNPAEFVPQFGGWCAYAVAVPQEKVDIDPHSFLVQDGKLLLFYKGFLNDTRKTWLSDKKKDPQTYLKEATVNWPSVKTKEP
jgi:YHS domain-containing protein